MKTYTHKRSRAEVSLLNTSSRPSSPIGNGSHQDNISVPELLRRMQKRSRRVSRGLDQNDDNPAAKVTDGDATMSSSPEKPLAEMHLPLKSQNINDLSYQTPQVADQSMTLCNNAPLMPETLSPVPKSRRVLSRASSRNLKENEPRKKPRGLESPFSSRPGSLTSSPATRGGLQHRPPMPARALSATSTLRKESSLSALQPVPGNPHRYVTPIPFGDGFALDMNSTDNQKDAITAHGRASSIPTMPSTAALNPMSSNNWLVPPKALSRSPKSIFDPDAFLTEHASFYVDTPAQVSTPVKEKPIVDPAKTKKASIYSDDSDFNISESEPDDSPPRRNRTAVVHALLRPASPRQPGRRRRTITHLSSDSIFSSPLDFSTYVTDDEDPDHIRRATVSRQSSVAPRQNSTQREDNTRRNRGIGVGLDSAFAPAPADTRTGSVASRRSIGKRVVDVESSSESENDDDDLLEMFSTLDLGGRIEGETAPTSISQFASGSQNEGRQRRKRGDTIRASDFPRPSASTASTVSSTSVAPSACRSVRGPSDTNTRRTRSGTVVLANAVRPTPTLSAAAGGTSSNNGEISSKSSRAEVKKPTRRSQGAKGKPKLYGDPPPPPDDEDDELLLA